MKKLISMLVVTVMLLSCVAVNAAVEPVTLYPDSQGLYSMDYALSNAGVASATDGDMYGLVVVEAAKSVEDFTLDQSAIRYIDQGEASNGKLVFDTEKFGPKALTDSETNKYLMYIGGEGLSKATYIGELSTTGPVATDITFDKETYKVYVGKDITITATVKPEGYGLAVDSWESSDNEKATVDNGKVTGVAIGEVTITVKAGDITKTVTVSVEEFVGVLGDINGDTEVDIRDAMYLFNYSMDPEDPEYAMTYTGNIDYTKDGELDIRDAMHLFNYSMDPEDPEYAID